jgi:hypothetical protein
VSGAGPTPSGGQGRDQPHNIATAIAEVSERATLLVREEIELAKAEVTEKATKLIKGAIVGVVAGIFFMTALVFALVGCAWLLYYFLPGNEFTFFWGFFAMAAILVLLGVIAGLVAARAVKRGSPPMPSMAIEEARKIRETVSAGPAAEVVPAAFGASAGGNGSSSSPVSSSTPVSSPSPVSSPTPVVGSDDPLAHEPADPVAGAPRQPGAEAAEQPGAGEAAEETGTDAAEETGTEAAEETGADLEGKD